MTYATASAFRLQRASYGRTCTFYCEYPTLKHSYTLISIFFVPISDSTGVYNITDTTKIANITTITNKTNITYKTHITNMKYDAVSEAWSTLRDLDGGDNFRQATLSRLGTITGAAETDGAPCAAGASEMARRVTAGRARLRRTLSAWEPGDRVGCGLVNYRVEPLNAKTAIARTISTQGEGQWSSKTFANIRPISRRRAFIRSGLW